MNQIFVIEPYWHAGTWVFDDESRGLDKEPFVEGIPEMISDFVREIPGAEAGFQLLFSSAPFPGAAITMQLQREEFGGHWYQLEGTEQEGWLCPALQQYFETPPDRIFAKVSPIVGGERGEAAAR